jgi:predicted O-methyltransferase YrrM
VPLTAPASRPPNVGESAQEISIAVGEALMWLDLVAESHAQRLLAEIGEAKEGEAATPSYRGGSSGNPCPGTREKDCSETPAVVAAANGGQAYAFAMILSRRGSFAEALQPGRNLDALRWMPPVWTGSFWDSLRLAKQAIDREAAQKIRELAPLVAVLRGRSLETVVEIGTAAGGTFFVWCEIAATNALMVSIDLPGGPFSPSTSSVERLRGYARPEQRVHFFRDDSHLPSTKEALLRVLGGRSIDFLFIDGDHSYEGVRRDFDLYAPLVGRGGIIAFHDIAPHPPASGCRVEQLWNEIKPGRTFTEYIDRGDYAWGGIGVIYVE